MRIAIATDHAGFPLKAPIVELLLAAGHEPVDFGTAGTETVDYPDVIAPGARAVASGDCSLGIVLGGTLLLAVFLAVAPGMPTQGNPLAALLVIVFGFFFVTVASRIVGLIGSSSSPVSGMTIATLILTCTILVAIGWTGDVYAPIA